jgi:hypothetical protein
MSTPAEGGEPSGPPERLLRGVFRGFPTPCHLVWGRVVPDIPEFCRELVAALAEE